jgi:hydroxypyruvate reductase
LNTTLLACGARVDEINTLRRHLDQLKGGGLARQAYPARVVSLILSDVVGNPLEGIASGPTAPDPSSRADALTVLEKYHLLEKLPASIPEALRTAPETAKPGDAVFGSVRNVLVGSNLLAVNAALMQAEGEGFSSHLLGTNWQGEAREVAQEFCRQIKQSNYQRPYCLIAGGETTVSLHGKGKGGRNQELALAVVQELAGMPDVVFITLATDGEDGPTDAAGAVVSSDTLQRGQALRLSTEVYLDDNDSYSYFHALGDLLKPGSTGTNVNDLIFCFGF